MDNGHRKLQLSDKARRITYWGVFFACYIVIYSSAQIWKIQDGSYWSVWAYGDAQMLTAGINFASDGFLFHNLLPLVNPGYLHDFISNNGPYGRYTHYPALHAVFLGFLSHVFGKDDAYFLAAKCVFAGFSLAALVVYYRLVIVLFSSGFVAAIATIILSVSAVFVGFTASLCDQSLGLFLSVLFFYLHYRSNFAPFDTRHYRFYCLGLLAVTLAGSLNSIEYIPIDCALSFLAFLVTRRVTPFLIVLGGTFAGIALHFFQVVWEFGSIDLMAAHFADLFSNRVNFGRFFVILFGELSRRTPFLYPLLLLWLFYSTALLARLRRNGTTTILEGWKYANLMVLSTFAFYLVLPQQALLMSDYSYRHLLVAVLPVTLFYVEAAAKELLSLLKNLRYAVFRSPSIYVYATYLVVAASVFITFMRENVPSILSARVLGISYFWHIGSEKGRQLVRSENQLRWLRQQTSRGDIVVVADSIRGNTEMEVNPIAEYWAQRHLLPTSFSEMSLRGIQKKFRTYVEHFAEIDPRVRTVRLLLLCSPRAVPLTLREQLRSMGCYAPQQCLYGELQPLSADNFNKRSKYQTGEIITFDSGAPYVEFIGWYPAEQTHRWAKGESSKVLLRLSNLDPNVKQYDLVLKIFTFAGHKDVTVLINKTKAASLSLSGPVETMRIPLDAGMLKSNADNIVEFKTSGALSPHSLDPNNNDGRILGLGLVEFGFFESRLTRL